MVAIIQYKIIKIDHAILIKVLYDGTVSYLTFSTDGVLNTNNNETSFPELAIFFEEHFEMKFQEGSVLKYLNLRICQSPFGFSVYHTDHIMEQVNEWFPTGKFRRVDTHFRTDSTYEKELMAALPLTGNTLHKEEMEYHGKFRHTIGRIQPIYLMS